MDKYYGGCYAAEILLRRIFAQHCANWKMMTEREKEGEEASICAQRVVLEKEYEFRFEVDFGATATIQVFFSNLFHLVSYTFL